MNTSLSFEIFTSGRLDPKFYERFTSLHSQVCEYQCFSTLLAVTIEVKFKVIMLVS